MSKTLVQFSPPVYDLIISKQLEFRKEKNRVVSMAYTVERLIKEAYLKAPDELKNMRK